jgi:hypothetical protein
MAPEADDRSIDSSLTDRFQLQRVVELSRVVELTDRFQLQRMVELPRVVELTDRFQLQLTIDRSIPSGRRMDPGLTDQI